MLAILAQVSVNSYQSSLDIQSLAPSQSMEGTFGSDIVSNGLSISSEPHQVNIVGLVS